MEASKCKKFKLDFWNVVTIGIFLIFAVCLIYPLFSLFFSSLKDSNTGEFTLSNFVQFFTKKYHHFRKL
ncbi:Binding-protein-dependent transport system inner membrane component, partial [human gut metagenome]